MKCLILLLCGLWLPWVCAQNPAPVQNGPPPTDLATQPVPLFILPEADTLLASVRARLPQEKLMIQAKVGTRLKREYRKLQVHTTLDYGAAVPMAQYSVFDNFGTLREVMQVRFPQDGQPELHHFVGDSKIPNPAFESDQLIEGLQFGWNELSLAFLWWPNAKTIDRGYTKARQTFIVDIPVPGEVKLPYQKIRVHIDQREKFIYKAIAYHEQNGPIREIEANRLMKIDNLWMVKDIEIKAWPGPIKTVVTVEDVKRNEQSLPLQESRPVPESAPGE